jgi:hypothetical protein
MNIYSPSSDVFESLRTFSVDYNQLEIDGHLIPIFIDVPWNKGITGYTRETFDIESWKANISKGRKGQPSSFKGKFHSKEANEKNRQSHLGKQMSQETKEKISISRLGSIHSDKTKTKISNANKGKPSQLKGTTRPDDVKQKISEGMRGKKRVYREDGTFYMK